MRAELEVDHGIYDHASALASVGGDWRFLSEIAGLFQAAWPTLLSDIRSGLRVGDMYAVGRSAHLVEAAARNISARNVYEAAEELELLARRDDLQASHAACERLEREVGMLMPHLVKLQTPNSIREYTRH